METLLSYRKSRLPERTAGSDWVDWKCRTRNCREWNFRTWKYRTWICKTWQISYENSLHYIRVCISFKF